MTSSMTTAAAHETWLGIPAAQHPPHHYALLGLPPLAANEHAIFQAYQHRATLVGQHLGGPHADAARRLLAELAAAQACLLNAAARATYDRWLSERLGPAAKASGSAAGLSRPAPRSNIEPPVAAATKSDDVSPPPYIDSEAPPSALPWIIAGACAGLLAVAVLGVALFGMQRRQRSHVAEAANATTTQQRAGDGRKQTGRTATAASNSGANTTDIAANSDDDVLGQRIAPLTTKPELLHPDASVVGPPDTSSSVDVSVAVDDGDEETPAKPPTPDDGSKPDPDSSSPETAAPATESTSAPSKLPQSFALPSRTNNDAQGILAKLPIKDPGTVNLKLDTVGMSASGGNYQLQSAVEGLAPGERMWPVGYTAADGTTRAVGEYTLADGELGFRWAESAQSIDEVLANSALDVSFDDRKVSINQRAPDAVAPLKLAVDIGAITTAEKLESPPPHAKLYLALDGQNDDFPAHQLQPAEPVVAGQDVDLIFGEATDPYRLAMRVSLVENGAGGIRLEARPMFQAIDQGQKWDYFRPKSVLQTLAQLKQQESLLDARLQQLQQRFGRNGAQLQQATELYNRQATELQTRILVLEKLNVLCEELNASGVLNYRVFAKVGEREVDLVDSSLGITIPVATPAEPPADDPSAIVGPPTDPPAPTPKDKPAAK